jgi:hypothetical protein
MAGSEVTSPRALEAQVTTALEMAPAADALGEVQEGEVFLVPPA